MKNNRKIRLSSSDIEKYNIATTPPPKGSIFWQLWDSCIDIAHETLQTKFIEGIKNGTLDPIVFGAFNVDDGYYCFNGADDYLTASKKAKNELLKFFLKEKYNSYLTYNESFTDTWHIKDASSVIPTSVTKAYSDYERSVVLTKETIYSLVVMLPCDYLWYWFSTKIENKTPNNIYEPWIDDNLDSSSAYAIGNVLNLFSNEIDIGEATEIYKNAMTFELNNFKQATQ